MHRAGPRRRLCRPLASVPRITEEPFTEMDEETTGSAVGKIKSAVLNMLSARHTGDVKWAAACRREAQRSLPVSFQGENKYLSESTL